MNVISSEQITDLSSIHPGLQKLVIENGWKDLSLVQKAAIPVILDGHDCIVEAPTAGGKTEAVFFPALTRIADHKKESVQILYLAPLRALLNDIELRAEAYAKACGLHCFKWHGDVSQKRKIDTFSQPPNVLLTTPESLEAIMLRKAGWHLFFADLDVVIIDEAHNFASGDRGSHLISLLSRLEKSVQKHPQRIAVTATVGNPEGMLEWLAGPERKIGQRIHVSSSHKQTQDYQILYFDERRTTEGQPTSGASYRQFRTLYQLLPSKKSIVFARSRTKSEALAAAINQANKLQHSKNPITIRTHHSAVSKYYREEAENRIKMRHSIEGGLTAIISTSTLELGIDVGELDQVVQCEALVSSSSFLQRVGRTGRRKNKARFFRGLCIDEDDLLLLTAVVSLGERGISEAIALPRKAYHILAHQLICLSLQNNGISATSAWNILNGIYCFSGIEVKQFHELLTFMIAQNYFRQVDELLVVAEETERVLLGSNWRRLFAVFDSGPMYDVWHGKKHVGTLDSAFVEALDPPFLFILGGIEWEATKVKSKSRKVLARKTSIGDAPRWVSYSGQDVPYETAKEAGRLLFGSRLPEILNEEALEAFISIQDRLKEIGWTENSWIISINHPNEAEIWTFAGDQINRTLAKLTTQSGIGQASSSYQSIVVKKTKKSEVKFVDSIMKFLQGIQLSDSMIGNQLRLKLFGEMRLTPFSKFARCLPKNLWYEAHAERIFDLDGLIAELKRASINVLDES